MSHNEYNYGGEMPPTPTWFKQCFGCFQFWPLAILVILVLSCIAMAVIR